MSPWSFILKIVIKDAEFYFLLSFFLFCRQIQSNFLLDDCHFSYIRNLKKEKKNRKERGKAVNLCVCTCMDCVNAHLALRFTQIAQWPCVIRDESTLVIVSTKSQLVHLALTHPGNLELIYQAWVLPSPTVWWNWWIMWLSTLSTQQCTIHWKPLKTYDSVLDESLETW